MQKFSNYKEPKKEIDITKEDEVVSKLVDFSIKTQLTNEDLTTKEITLEGKDELVEKILELIDEEKEKAITQVKESVRLNFNKFVNQEQLNESLKSLENQLKNI